LNAGCVVSKRSLANCHVLSAGAVCGQGKRTYRRVGAAGGVS
jgi:hypothetical protein